MKDDTDARIDELVAYLRCLTPEQTSPLAVPTLETDDPYAPVFSEAARAQAAMNAYAAEKRLTTDVVAKINALMGHLADPNVHQRAREQFIEIIAQAAGYQYALLAEQEAEPNADQMRITAVVAPAKTQMRLEKALGFTLKGYRFPNDVAEALETPPVELFTHVSDFHEAVPRALGTAVGKYLSLREIVVIRQISGDKYMGAVIFIGTRHDKLNRSLVISLSNNYLVYALRLLQEQESLNRLYKSYTARLEKEVRKRTAELETSLDQARAAERRRQAAEERTKELNRHLVQARQDAENRLAEAESLLQGLRVLSNTLDPDQILHDIIDVLREVLDFDQALVLSFQDGEFRTIAATHSELEALAWQPDDFFVAVLDGQTRVAPEITAVAEWQANLTRLSSLSVGSALHIGLKTSLQVAMLICTHPTAGFFTTQHENLGQRFAALAAQALHNTSLYAALRQERDTLEARVIERTREIQSLARFPEENPSPVLRVDEHGRILYRNAASRMLTPLFVARATSGFVPPDWQEIITQILGDDTAFEVDYHFEEQTLWCKFSPVPHERYVNIYCQDITVRQKAEQALRASEERLSLIVDNALDAVITIDAHGRIATWNKQAELTFGWAADEVANRELAEVIVPPQHREAHRAGLRRYLETGRAGTMLNRRTETTAVHRDGQAFPIEIAITAVDLEGTVMFNAFVRDITTRLRASAELERAKEEAEAAAQAKSLFLANMSHEIRTPLNAIIGLSDLLLDTNLDYQQEEHLYMVRRSGDALLSIINDILDFSKIDAGKMELEESDFYLRSVLEDATGILRQKALNKGLTLAYEIDPAIPNRLVGDTTRLRQVLVNLLSNGIKFTEEGAVRVTVTAVDDPSRNQIELHFQVIDTGIGIPPGRVNRLFQSFSQVDASTTRRFGGTGLGLAISKRLVELMDGRMWVESLVGVGSTFHFTVWLGLARKPDTALLSRAWTKLDYAHLLIVSTHQRTVDFLANYAEAWQMSFVHARTSVGAERQLATEKKPTAVLIDLDSLAEDAQTLTLALRQLLPGLPFISLCQRKESLTPALRALYDGHVYKPLRPSRLYNMLAALTTDEETLRAAKAGHTAVDMADPQMSTRHPLRILIAEDNQINQRVALSMLERLGYTADVANNGLEALEHLHAQDYDVILMDVQMPRLDGVSTTERIRTEFTADKQPWIIAMTANALKGDREKYLASGMDAYLSKPVRLTDLADLLDAAPVATGDDRNDLTADVAPSDPVDVERFFFMLGVEDMALLLDILPTFIKESKRQIGLLQTALAEEDLMTLEQAAHMLKGSAASVGAIQFAQLAAGLNEAARSGVLPTNTAVLDELVAELARIEAQYETMRAVDS